MHHISKQSSVSGNLLEVLKISVLSCPRFDVGPILYKTEVQIDRHIKRPELTEMLANKGADALEHVLQDLDRFLSTPLPQDEGEAKLSPKLVQEMSYVDWKSKTAEEVYNLYRGLYGMFKLKTYFLNKVVDLDEVGLVAKSIDEGNSSNVYNLSQFVIDKLPDNATPGQIVYVNETLFVKCSKSGGTYKPYVFIKRFKLGKKWMSAKDFQNGFLSKCQNASESVFYSHQQNCDTREVSLKKAPS